MKSINLSWVVAGLLLIIMIFVIIMSNINRTGNEFQRIEITGNGLLTAKAYSKFAELTEQSALKLSAAEIRDRLVKHPYISDVVVYTGKPGIAEVRLIEKTISARLITACSEHLLSKAGEIIPLLAGTKNPDVPVIGGLNGDQKLLLTQKEKERVSSAFKVVMASAIDSTLLERNISDINISGDGPMVVTVSGIDPVFVLDDKNIERQTAYMYNLLKSRSNYLTALQTARYIDVRFNKKIFIGS